MSEQGPEQSPEYEWLTDVCGEESCKKTFEVRPDNSRINLYEDHPECANVFTYCPHCENYFMRLFIISDDPQEFVEMGFEPFIEEQTPKHILAAYENIVQSMKPPEEPEPEPQLIFGQELTQRQENLINFMAYILMTEQLAAQDFNGSGDLFI